MKYAICAFFLLGGFLTTTSAVLAMLADEGARFVFHAFGAWASWACFLHSFRGVSR